MKSRVLYFPYIRIPESAWLTQMLLYWDRISSIVPYDYIRSPESLGPFMVELVREELVQQVMPGAYIHEIPSFGDRFLGYLEGLGVEIDRRIRDFALQNPCSIHIEKMGKLGEDLVNLQLARVEQYPWYSVERETADDFMSYLATALGQLESIDSSPVTDTGMYLQRLTRAGVPDQQIAEQLELLRTAVLNEVLPVPTRPIKPSAIRSFKEKHAGELRDFRLRVERELVAAANVKDPELRQRQLEIFFHEAADRIAEIQESMRGAGWETAKSALSLVAAIPGVTPLLGLAGAVFEAVTGTRQSQTVRDFAYAAHAGVELARDV